jgi:DNA repair protein RecO (recombination protein O)
MQKMQAEGVVLQSIPFKETQRIVALFTPHEGVMKLILKRGATGKHGQGYGIEPLSRIEVVYAQGRSDLFPCFETVVLDAYLPLRSRLELLQAACEMVQAVSCTQQPGKPASELFQLLTAYLSRLPDVRDPRALSSSFKLKTLRFEGVFAAPFLCSRCATPLNGTSFHVREEVYCAQHALSPALPFAQEERDLMLLLAFGRDFSILRDLALEEELVKKISELFDCSIERRK